MWLLFRSLLSLLQIRRITCEHSPIIASPLMTNPQPDRSEAQARSPRPLRKCASSQGPGRGPNWCVVWQEHCGWWKKNLDFMPSLRETSCTQNLKAWFIFQKHYSSLLQQWVQIQFTTVSNVSWTHARARACPHTDTHVIMYYFRCCL